MSLEAGLGEALRTDYFLLREQFTPAQLAYLEKARAFVHDEVLPVINGYWERAEFPWPLVRKLGEAGLVGDGIEGYGCPDMDPLAAGLVTMELHRGDGSLGTFLGVRAGLAMRSIAMLGSQEHKQRWLPAMADVIVVWARDTEDGQVKGFLVERGTPGYNAPLIEGKGSLRAVWQAEIALDGVRLADLSLSGRVEPTLAGLAKAHNTTAAPEVLAEARDLLGGNGILLDFHVISHMADIAAIHTFEGTATIQNLIVGRDITGASAFSTGA